MRAPAGKRRLVDAAPVRAHLQTIVDLDVTRYAIRRAAGVEGAEVVTGILNGQARTTAHNEALLLAVPADLVAIAHALYDDTLLPRHPFDRRYRALARLGWPDTTIDERAGAPVAHLHRRRGETVTARTVTLIDEAWLDLRDQWGPDPDVAEAARRLAWPWPRQWQRDPRGMDHPEARPHRGLRGTWRHDDPVTTADEIAWLEELGGSVTAIASQLGIEPASVASIRSRTAADLDRVAS